MQKREPISLNRQLRKWQLRKIITRLILGAVLGLCSSCADNGATSSDKEGTDPGTLRKNALSDSLFNDDSLRTYEIWMDPDSLAAMDADPTAEKWVGARSLIIGHDTMGPIGVRYKGNEGAWWVSQSGSNKK